MSEFMQQPDTARACPLPARLGERIPHARHLGMQVIKDGGFPIFYLPFRDNLVGNTHLPALHGGAVSGFMENAALMHLLLDQDRVLRLPKTIDFNIDYLRAAGPRDSFACCEVVKLGSRVALVHIRCWQRHYDRPSALARGHYLWEALDKAGEMTETLNP